MFPAACVLGAGAIQEIIFGGTYPHPFVLNSQFSIPLMLDIGCGILAWLAIALVVWDLAWGMKVTLERARQMHRIARNVSFFYR